jgi:hypothetical protein
VPQGGGTSVPIYSSSTPPLINLVQLDQLGEIIANATVPNGTYTAAQLTLSANNNGTTCDVSLVVSADPESGFDLPAGTAVPCSQMVIAGAQGTSPNMTVPLTITLASPLVVTSSSTSALDLEFDLSHPALIVEHYPASASAPTWVVNFNGPVHHRLRPDLTKLVLRHTYGQVASVADSAITIDKAYAVHPITSPETATVSSTALTINADSTNGTLYYDLDNSDTPTTIYNFSQLTTALPSMFVRVAARYDASGNLWATRIYAASTFDKIWKNPEGHVLHVNTTTNVMHVSTENGGATALQIGSNTQFYFGSSNTLVGTGTAFFDGFTATTGGLPNIARGFKVNATIDPLSTSTPPVALTVEIDAARYDGLISSPTATGFNYTRNFAMADSRAGKDDYSGTLDYISSTSANTDQQGNSIDGFYWWNFAFPTLADTGSTAVTDFESAASGSVNFGGTVGTLKTYGLSRATWNDSAAPNTWSAPWTVLMPAPAPLGLVSTPFSSTSNSFYYTVPTTSTVAALPVQVDLNTTSGSATLVYQIDRQSGVITVTPQDISNATTLATVANYLSLTTTPVKVFGVPQADHSIKAYALFYYTHTASTK